MVSGWLQLRPFRSRPQSRSSGGVMGSKFIEGVIEGILSAVVIWIFILLVMCFLLFTIGAWTIGMAEILKWVIQ